MSDYRRSAFRGFAFAIGPAILLWALIIYVSIEIVSAIGEFVR